MSITITDTTTTLDLPPDLFWADEFTWSPVEQSADFALDGAVIVQTATRQAGRPITLQSGSEFAWLRRDVLDQLRAWANNAGQELTLTIRGAPRTVIFRHQDAPVIEAEMVLYHAAPTEETDYTATIRLMEV